MWVMSLWTPLKTDGQEEEEEEEEEEGASG